MAKGGSVAQKPVEKLPEPVPKEYQKLIKEFNATLEAIKTAKSDKDVTKHLQNLANMYDELMGYIFFYESGSEKITATLFNEFWKIPKFQDYLDVLAGETAFAEFKSAEQIAFTELKSHVQENNGLLSGAPAELMVSAGKAVVSYLIEYVNIKEFQKELGLFGHLIAGGFPKPGTFISGKMDRPIVFACLLYMRRHYAMEAGKKSKEIPVFKIEPKKKKIKAVPKKPPPVPKKIEKKPKVKKKKKPKTKEEQALEKVIDVKDEIKSWKELVNQYSLDYAGKSFLTAEYAILEMRAMGNGATLAANELLFHADQIIEKIHGIDDMVLKEDLLGVFLGNEVYTDVIFLEGNALIASIETIKEQLGMKPSPYFKETWTALKAEYEKWKIEQMPSITADTGPAPTPAEQAEIDKMLTNPSYAICKQYGPPLCGPGEYTPTKEEKIETVEMLVYMIPVVGPVYSIGKSVKMIKDRNELLEEADRMEAELNKRAGELSPAEYKFMEEQILAIREAAGDWKAGAVPYAMIALDVAFLGLDISFIGSFVIKSGAKGIGRNTIAAMKSELAAGKLITTAEKELMSKALYEFSEDELKHFFKLVKDKGSLGKVVGEMDKVAEKMGKKEVDSIVMKEYLKKNPLPKGFIKAWKKTKEFVSDTVEIEDGLSLFSKQKFEKRMIERFYMELVPNLDYTAVHDLSGLMTKQGLKASEKQYAVDTVFYTMMSFDKKSQQALLKLFTEKGFSWKQIVKKIQIEEKTLTKQLNAGKLTVYEGDSVHGMATRNVLMDLLPEYKAAYKKAPYDHWVQMGLFLTGVGFGFSKVIDVIEAKGEAAQKKAQKELEELQTSEGGSKLMKLYMMSEAFGG